MRSKIVLRQVKGGTVVSSADYAVNDAHPGGDTWFVDNWQSVAKLIGYTLAGIFIDPEILKAAEEEAKSLAKDVMKGANKSYCSESSNIRPPLTYAEDYDQIQVDFIAWSEDDLKGQTCKVIFVPPEATKCYEELQKKSYQVGYVLDTNNLASKTYPFMFGAQDDGWFYDVAVMSVLQLGYLADIPKLAVINTAGEVWARDLDLSGGNVGAGVKLTGPGLFGGPDDQFVVASQNSMAVITTSGAFWPRVVRSELIDPELETSGSLFGGQDTKYVLYGYWGRTVYVVNTAGEVWTHSIIRNGDVYTTSVGPGGKMNGPSLFGGSDDKYVVLEDGGHGKSRILVINTQGEVWAHDIEFDTISTGYKLDGPGLFGAPHDKYVTYIDGNLLVVNTDGEVWARNISDSAVGPGVKLNGPRLFGGPDDKYVVTYHMSAIPPPPLPPPPPKVS